MGFLIPATLPEEIYYSNQAINHAIPMFVGVWLIALALRTGALFLCEMICGASSIYVRSDSLQMVIRCDSFPEAAFPFPHAGEIPGSSIHTDLDTPPAKQRNPTEPYGSILIY